MSAATRKQTWDKDGVYYARLTVTVDGTPRTFDGRAGTQGAAQARAYAAAATADVSVQSDVSSSMKSSSVVERERSPDTVVCGDVRTGTVFPGAVTQHVPDEEETPVTRVEQPVVERRSRPLSRTKRDTVEDEEGEEDDEEPVARRGRLTQPPLRTEDAHDVDEEVDKTNEQPPTLAERRPRRASRPIRSKASRPSSPFRSAPLPRVPRRALPAQSTPPEVRQRAVAARSASPFRSRLLPPQAGCEGTFPQYAVRPPVEATEEEDDDPLPEEYEDRPLPLGCAEAALELLPPSYVDLPAIPVAYLPAPPSDVYGQAFAPVPPVARQNRRMARRVPVHAQVREADDGELPERRVKRARVEDLTDADRLVRPKTPPRRREKGMRTPAEDVAEAETPETSGGKKEGGSRRRDRRRDRSPKPKAVAAGEESVGSSLPEWEFEEDNTGIDYMTALNHLGHQKQGYFANFRYEHSRPSSRRPEKRVSAWNCTYRARMKLESADAGEERTMEVVVLGESKRKAKQLAAKKMTEKVNAYLDDAIAEGRIPMPVAKPPRGQSENNAVSVLHEWWQKGLFEKKPEFGYREVEEGTYFLFKVWYAVNLNLNGMNEQVVGKATDAVKKVALRYAAEDAVRKILAMELPGFREALVAKNKPSQLGAGVQQTKDGGELAPNTKVMCRDSDEEGVGLLQRAPAKDGPFKLKEGFDVVFARREEDVDEWVGRHAKEGGMLGVYADSVMMRAEMLALARSAGYDAGRHDARSSTCEVVCLSADDSALVVLRERFASADGTATLPRSLRRLLRRPPGTLIGLLSSAARAAIRSTFAVRVADLWDVGLNALALSGQGGCAVDVVRDWTRKTLQPFARSAIEDVPGLDEVLTRTDAVVAPAVYVATVGVEVRRRCRVMAQSREIGFQGRWCAFGEVAGRLVGRKRGREVGV